MGIESRNQSFQEQGVPPSSKCPRSLYGKHTSKGLCLISACLPFLEPATWSSQRQPNPYSVLLSITRTPQIITLDSSLVLQLMHPLHCCHWASWSGETIMTTRQWALSEAAVYSHPFLSFSCLEALYLHAARWTTTVLWCVAWIAPPLCNTLPQAATWNYELTL